MTYFVPDCKYCERIVDWVPYGSTNVPMYSMDCTYSGPLTPSDECNNQCPAWEPIPEEEAECEEV